MLQSLFKLKFFNWSAPLICMLLYLFLAGCENSLQPVDREKGIYSIYGVLDMREETNYIRVKDLNQTLLQDTAGTINATVVLTDLNNGFQDIMQDSIVEFDGVKTHNFYTNMEILPENRYRVSVERDDGRTVTSDAVTPAFAETNVEPINETCNVSIRLTFTPVEDRNNLRLTFGFFYESQLQWVIPRSNTLGNPGDFSDDNDVTEVFRFTPKQLLDLYPTREGDELWCHELDSEILYVRYTHYGPGFFDNTTSDSLIIPGGTGRFGALYKDTLNFPIDTANICKPFC